MATKAENVGQLVHDDEVVYLFPMRLLTTSYLLLKAAYFLGAFDGMKVELNDSGEIKPAPLVVLEVLEETSRSIGFEDQDVTEELEALRNGELPMIIMGDHDPDLDGSL